MENANLQQPNLHSESLESLDLFDDDNGSNLHEETGSNGLMMEEMDFEDLDLNNNITIVPVVSDVSQQLQSDHTGNRLNTIAGKVDDILILPVRNKIVEPVRDHVIQPINQLHEQVDKKLDTYLDELGNPMILKKFIYILMISMVTWIIWRSNLVIEYADGTIFINHDHMLSYISKKIDLNKFETDLHYLTDVPHMSGTKGDTFIGKYITDTWQKNNLDSIDQQYFKGYTNYPIANQSTSLILTKFNSNNETIANLTLNDSNFVPLTVNGYINGTNLIYGHIGSEDDWIQLNEKSTLDDEFTILLHYSTEIPIHEQLLLAQQFNAKGVIFISNDYIDSKGMIHNEMVQQSTSALVQYGLGDVLSPNIASYSNFMETTPDRADLLTRIPIIAISAAQGETLLSKLNSKDANTIKYDNGWYSGIFDDIKIYVNVTTDIKPRQSIFNIVGKLEGQEQEENAIIIGATRNSISPNAIYPDFGTTLLLNLVELFQDLHFRYKWRPMRSIYFISFGGNEFNHIGSTELMQLKTLQIVKEVYSFIDISQMSLNSTLQIQCHPLLESLFKHYPTSSNITVNEKIDNYGDWTPFLSNGIPIAIFSSKDVTLWDSQINNLENGFNKISNDLKNDKIQNELKNTIMYLLGSILKLIDDPNIPFNLLHFIKIVDDEISLLQRQYRDNLKFTTIIRSMLQWKRLGQQWVKWNKKWNEKFNNNDIDTDKVIEPIPITKERWAWNLKLTHIGKKIVNEYGLPNRKFYKNVLFGPTLWKKYGSDNDLINDTDENNLWIFPGVKDAIWRGDWRSAQAQLNIIGRLLNEAVHSISKE